MRPSRAALVLVAASAALSASAEGIGEATRARLAEALACANLSIADLGWDKRPVTDRFRLPCVDRCLDEPLALAGHAESAEADFGADPAGGARAAAGWLGLAPPRVGGETPRWEARAPRGRNDARSVALELAAALERARALRAEAVAGLGYDGAAVVEAGAKRLYADESEDAPFDAAPVLRAAGDIDLLRLVEALATLADAAAAALGACPDMEMPRAPSRFVARGMRISIGGVGRDVHAGADVVVDPGGDDVYEGCALVLDLSGDDTYRGTASGCLTVGLLVDVAGDDRHLGGDFAQGAGLVGASLLLDVAGHDVYSAGQVSQGAGVLGVGLLYDLAGNDAYRGARFVQGFGGVAGLGVLSDRAGNDTYWAGGTFSHAPLLPDSYQSLSQGFGFGMRGQDASGGVGILVDSSGNDSYAAEVYGQGASYWLALGILVDGSGNDKYDLFQYGQGAGIHLSAGVLMDRAGSDAYSCNNGVAQGCGHDWATGLLWDRGGFDCYQGSGMTQGSSNANAVGILIDEAGNDSYAGWNEKVQGDSFPARGTIGLGALLDMGGKDAYTSGGRDGALWTRGSVGVGMDVAEPGP